MAPRQGQGCSGRKLLLPWTRLLHIWREHSRWVQQSMRYVCLLHSFALLQLTGFVYVPPVSLFSISADVYCCGAVFLRLSWFAASYLRPSTFYLAYWQNRMQHREDDLFSSLLHICIWSAGDALG